VPKNCEALTTTIRHEVHEVLQEAVISISIPVGALPQGALPNAHPAIGALAENLDLLRIEAGWSFDDMYQATGISKKLSIGHVRHGKGITPRNLRVYAEAFTKALKRPIAPQDLRRK
jgi:hypothetical protein